MKANGRIDSAVSNDGTSDYGIAVSVGVVASTQELKHAKKICTDVLTTPNCENAGSFDRNVNTVSSKLHKEDHNSDIEFIF